ncbi:hypothetical protein niasHS_009598 [Heterodera schachtii]|uniref:Uncharacterized protein n=1 Tax=Heterodera schachtii TaxID=97005 RepID=A0ABD2JBB8_HETSC
MFFTIYVFLLSMQMHIPPVYSPHPSTLKKKIIFGIVAKNASDCRRADPTALVLLHQSDLGEYIRNEAMFT